ncbi:hypothetical protein HPB50_022666 [Hyalomma asiaticum]|uniref:Uncharacterized protein n=1 Tax=Hyalomma asiaticum TaxID=266040 RepID=A0ACB7T9K8_HYAAI|nr:hypothetical protein HPB50_022666 [Hyalomma asiaticum]
MGGPRRSCQTVEEAAAQPKLKQRIARITAEAEECAATLTNNSWHNLCDRLNGYSATKIQQPREAQRMDTAMEGPTRMAPCMAAGAGRLTAVGQTAEKVRLHRDTLVFHTAQYAASCSPSTRTCR